MEVVPGRDVAAVEDGVGDRTAVESAVRPSRRTTAASTALYSLTRVCTAARRATSAELVLDGFASSDWQRSENAPGEARGLELPLFSSYMRSRLGMLATKISRLLLFAASAARAASMLVLNVAVGVIVPTVLVHASLAPISIVTYCAPCDTAFVRLGEHCARGRPRDGVGVCGERLRRRERPQASRLRIDARRRARRPAVRGAAGEARARLDRLGDRVSECRHDGRAR